MYEKFNTCDKCIFSFPVKDVNNIGADIMECRHNPPLAIPVAIHTAEGASIQMTVSFPRVTPDCWCGKSITGVYES